jgi:hypothetical protein
MISSIQPETFHQNSVIEWLSLANNTLTKIHPDALGLLRHLRHLDLSNNMISSIQPDTLHNISVTEWLSLANNRLTEIHPVTLRLLRHLRHLDLSHNMISSIQPETLHNNSVLEWLRLENNRLTETHLHIFQNQSKLSCLDLSGNVTSKVEGAMFYCNRKSDILLLTSNKIFEYIASNFREECELNISEINDEAFVGLENLKYLDLSSNNVTNISLTVFHSMLPQTEIFRSEGTCVSKVDCLNSSNISFHFGEYHSCNLTPIILRKMELSELRENNFSIFCNSSVNVLYISGALINLTGNPHTYECSLSQDIYENVTSLNCLSQGDLSTEKCNNLEHNDSIKTVGSLSSLSSSINGNSMPESVLIFGIYASSVFVAIVVVLIITHVVGKPEPDEFWWEDKLAKRNY